MIESHEYTVVGTFVLLLFSSSGCKKDKARGRACNVERMLDPLYRRSPQNVCETSHSLELIDMPTTVAAVATPASRADDINEGLGLLTGPNTGKGQDVLDKSLADTSKVFPPFQDSGTPFGSSASHSSCSASSTTVTDSFSKTEYTQVFRSAICHYPCGCAGPCTALNSKGRRALLRHYSITRSQTSLALRIKRDNTIRKALDRMLSNDLVWHDCQSVP